MRGHGGALGPHGRPWNGCWKRRYDTDSQQQHAERNL